MNKPRFAVIGEAGGTDEERRNTAIFVVLVILFVLVVFTPLVEKSPKAETEPVEVAEVVGE